MRWHKGQRIFSIHSFSLFEYINNIKQGDYPRGQSPYIAKNQN